MKNKRKNIRISNSLPVAKMSAPRPPPIPSLKLSQAGSYFLFHFVIHLNFLCYLSWFNTSPHFPLFFLQMWWLNNLFSHQLICMVSMPWHLFHNYNSFVHPHMVKGWYVRILSTLIWQSISYAFRVSDVLLCCSSGIVPANVDEASAAAHANYCILMHQC